MSPRIYAVKAVSEKDLDVTFFDGSVRRVDISEMADFSHMYLAVLGDRDIFEKAEVDKSKGRVVWPNGVRLSGDRIFVNSVLIEVITIGDAVVNFAERLRVYRESRFMTQKELGECTGIDQADISKIERAEVNPSLSTMARLIEGTGHSLQFAEEKPRVQGEYRIWDVLNLPGDDYVELINGVMYVMGTPSLFHQYIISEIHMDFGMYIREKMGDCMVLESPTGVRFEDDDFNYLLPDLLVVCDRSMLRKEGIMGAPDFILEVVSKSSKKNDTVRKLGIYSEKGVREYWVIDPEKECLIVYDLEHEQIPEFHFFNEVVPVRIYDGELKIDLSRFKDAPVGEDD